MKNIAQLPAKFTGRVSESVWVAVGGALGTLARHGVDVAMISKTALPLRFPWPTLLINLSGAALLGFIMAWVEESSDPPHWLRPCVAVGFCGAYTTFSTASLEVLLMARADHPLIALSYVAASVAGGLLLVTLSTVLAVKIFRNPVLSSQNLQP
ncbi:MAG: CrcB family protein [Chthoniobacterales bacterium]